ncbi:beta strand repeat-containing protein [Paludibaculum fermentans]|uniref:beta strand repeat-containing protein n=1 Tax=Paludibaculum fermentans TaxID=1473598 RepID=UPI003EBB3A23
MAGKRSALRSAGLVTLALCLVSLAWGVTYYASYTLNGGTATQSNQTYSASAADTSAVWVTNGGTFTLENPTITTSGNTSSQDNSSFYGLNAGLLAAQGTVNMTGGTITTTGTGANGAFAYGSGSKVIITGAAIKASADGGHAVMATGGGTMVITNVDMTTSGGSSSAIATDRGGGTIVVTGGTVKTSGSNSAGLYSTGSIVVTGTTFESTGAEMAVIEGANSLVLTGVKMTTTKEKWGVMIYQSMSGDASGTNGRFTMTGGSLNYKPTSGPLFYVNNSTGHITLAGVSLTANSGVLIKAAAGSWGNSGSNGGTVVLVGTGQTLAGNLVADSISSITATLKANSALTGQVNAENTAKSISLTLDSSSRWTLTGHSYVTSLADSAGIAGATVTNITGNGFNVYYDASASANSYLNGGTYSLVNGGLLLPRGSSGTSCSYAVSSESKSFTAAGGSGTASVTTTGTCTWSASSDSSWLSVNSGASGTGSGTVAFTVAANTTSASRTGTLTVGGQTIAITQEAGTSGGSGCSVTPGTTSVTVDAGAATRSIALTAVAGCGWSAASDAYWLTLSSSSGAGAGALTFTAAENTTGANRVGTLTVGGSTVTVTQSTLGVAPLAFVPISPCRLLDTRTNSSFGGTQMAAGETRTVSVPSGDCGIPANAAAYSLNVTVLPVEALAAVTAWPAGLPQPSAYTASAPDGRVKANAALVAAGTDAAVSLYSTEATDLVLDINGYFVPASTAPASALAFYPVTPCRLADTRLAAGDLGGPSLTAGEARTFPLAGQCGLPAMAQAYSVNIAAVPHSTLGSLQAWATGAAQTDLATLVDASGTVAANAAIVAAGTAGSIDLLSSADADVVIDVNGYFAPAASSGLYFYAVTPCRVADTRSADGELGGPLLSGGATRAFPLRSAACTVPTSAQAYSLNALAAPVSLLGYLTLWPADTAQPLVATLNAIDGVATTNAAIVAAGTRGAISAFVTEATHLLLDITGFFAP